MQLPLKGQVHPGPGGAALGFRNGRAPVHRTLIPEVQVVHVPISQPALKAGQPVRGLGFGFRGSRVLKALGAANHTISPPSLNEVLNPPPKKLKPES